MNTQQEQISALLDAVNGALNTNFSQPFTDKTAASDIFEAFIFCLVIDAARRQGATVAYSSVDGTVPRTFVFRTSPGHIYSTEKPYTNAILSFAKMEPLEVHAGVRVSCRSGVLHECDVAVIERSEAETCRRYRVPPRSSKLVLAVECKFYSTLLQLGLARSFIGLTADIPLEQSFFVTNTGSASVEKLLTKLRRKWDCNIVPDSNNDVERLRNQFCTLFRNYLAAKKLSR